MRNYFAAAVMGLALAIVSGCSGTGRFVYPENSQDLSRVSTGAPIFSGRVAVIPFEDLRTNDALGATILLGIIPLCPFGFREYDRPETNGPFTSINSCDFRPGEDLAKAAALSLKRSNLFNDAFFTYGSDANTADFILEGDIKSTYYKGRTFTYGLSIYSPVLWVVGLPLGTSLNRLCLQLRLKDKTGRVVWTFYSDDEDYLVQWIYFRNGRDVSLYSPLMQKVMNRAVNDMAARMKPKAAQR